MYNGSVRGALLVSVAAAASAATPAAAQVKSFDIPAQSATSGIAALGRQADVQIAASRKITQGKRTNAVHGAMTVDQALARLLRGTGLIARSTGVQTYTVLASPQTPEAPKAPAATSAPRPVPAPSRLRLDASATEGDDIVVTAQKRDERLQDVPVPVTVLAADRLAESGQVRLQDFFTKVPGLNFQAGSRGEPLVSIRGINSLQNPTVGVTIDDLPFGATIFRGGGNIAPDIDPSDLQRIEVLKGPQGTLYGVSSLGGLIKYVTVDPSPDAVRGQIATGIMGIDGSDDVGFNLRGSLNVPLGETVAVRASGFTRVTPGYIDNPAANRDDVNREEAWGGRAALLWKPSDALSVKLSALYQSRDMDGANQVTRALGGMNQNYLVESGWIKREIQSYTATIVADLGGVELTSLTGYNINRFNSSVDLSFAYAAQANASFGVAGAAYIEDYKTRKFNQELRFSGSIGHAIDLFVGGFYTKEKFTNPIEIYAANTSTGALVGRFQFYDGRGSYEEYAVFGDVTAHLTDKFDIQFGARHAHNRQSYSETDTGLLTAGGTLVIPNTVVKESPFTYLVTPRYTLSGDFMVYGRFASGYRAGGINLFFARGFPVPPGYTSDHTYNYEVGAKGRLFDRRLSFDLSLFHIDWRDLQLGFNFAPGVNFQSNGSRAKSQGVELTLSVEPWDGMTIAASGSYNDAVLTESFGSSTTRGSKGDRLPFSSKFTGSLSADQRFAISGNWEAFVGGTLAYVGNRIGLFRPTAVRQIYPEYTQVDLRAGTENGPWRISAFVTNVGNKRGIVGGGIGQTNPALFTYIQPRSYGLSLARSF